MDVHSKAHLWKQHDCHYLCVCGWYVPASVDPEQRIVREGKVELDIGWMVHGHMKPPKEPRRDRLALLGSDLDLAPVDGAASHPFLCREEYRCDFKTQTRNEQKHH